MPTINQFLNQISGALATTSSGMISQDVGIVLTTAIMNGIMVGLFIGLFIRATWWIWR